MKHLQIRFFFFYLLPHAVSICYYPTGDVAAQDTPCRSDTAQSTCCGESYACLSNNMCQATGNALLKEGASEFVRGSCTDKSWRSGDCPSFCVDPKYDNPAGGNDIGKCDGTDTVFYCIDSVEPDCDNEDHVLTFQDAPTALTTIGVTLSTTSSTPTMTPSSHTSSKRPSQTSTATDAASSNGHSSGSGSNNATAIGVGVGVGVGGLGMAALAATLFLLRKKRHKGSIASAETGKPWRLRLLPRDNNGVDQPDPKNTSREVYEAPGTYERNNLGFELQG